MEVIIDQKSGFCFGVKNAVDLAEKQLQEYGQLYCLGDIVHNEAEVERLANTGLIVISKEEFLELNNCTVLVRAHGEPPTTYEHAIKNNITIIEGTCPVVLKLQERVDKTYSGLKSDEQLLIFGKEKHPEVIGLNGRTNGNAVIIENESDLDKVDFSSPIHLFTQTTMPKAKYEELSNKINSIVPDVGLVKTANSICGQVANRGPRLEEFSKQFNAIVFAGGKKSSNSKVLFQHCKSANTNSYFVTSVDEVATLPLHEAEKVGVCGATSTPMWLMEAVAEEITKAFN